jgi:hypothetical protein
VIEWVVKNETCEQAKANQSAYACGTNANCTYPESGQGYRCSCNEGFEGNPYLQEGCQGKLVIAFSYDLTITNNYAYAGYVVPRCLLSCSVFIKIIFFVSNPGKDRLQIQDSRMGKDNIIL